MFTAGVNEPGLAFFIEAVGKAPRRGLTARRRPGLRGSNHSTSVMAFGAQGSERQGCSAAGSRRAPLARGRPGGAPEGGGAGSASPRRQPARERMRSRQPFSLALQNTARRPLSPPPAPLVPAEPRPRRAGGRGGGRERPVRARSPPPRPRSLGLLSPARARRSATHPRTASPRPAARSAAGCCRRSAAGGCLMPGTVSWQAPRSGRAAGRLRGRLRFPAPRALRRAGGKEEGRRAKPPPPPALRIPAPGRSALRAAEAFFLRHQLLPGGGPALRLRLGLGWGLHAPPRPGSGRSRGRGCTRSRGLRPAGLGCARGQGGRKAGGRKAAAEGPGRAAERCALTAPYAGEGMRGGGREARRGGGARVSRGPGQDGGAGPGLSAAPRAPPYRSRPRAPRLSVTPPAPSPARAGGAARRRFHVRWARAVSIVTGGRTARDPDDDVTRPLARSQFPSSLLLLPPGGGGVSLGPGGAAAGRRHKARGRRAARREGGALRPR